MNTRVVFTILFCMLLASATARASERFSARAWRRVKVYEMAELQKFDPPPIGKIVGVRFNYRHEQIRQPHAFWYLGSIWRVLRDAEKAEFMHVNVMVPEADLPAFKAITTDFQSRRKLVVYGEVMNYRDTSFPFLRLIGTKVKRNSRGNVTVGW